MKSFLCYCSLFLMAMFAVPLPAAPFSMWVDQKLPDGRVMKVHYEGDEFYCDFEDEAGRTLVQIGRDFFYAAVNADGELVATDKKLGDVVDFEPHRRASAAARRRGIEQRRAYFGERIEENRNRWEALKRNARVRRAAKKAMKDGSGLKLSPPSSPTVGTVVGCTLLIDFPVTNQNGEVTGTLWNQQHPSVTPAVLDHMINGTGSPVFGNYCSVREYFAEMSNHRLDYTNIVIGPVTVPYPREYYDDPTAYNDDQARILIKDAFNVLVASPDYAAISNQLTAVSYSGSCFKSLNVYFAGPQASTWNYGLWAHQWSLNSAAYNVVKIDVDGQERHFKDYQISYVGSSPSIFTFCHENGHLICGFPDLYEYTGTGNGVGCYSLMCRQQSNTCPGFVDAYLRAAAGWIEPKEVPNGVNVLSTTYGASGTVWRYANVEDESQYYLIEYRAQSGLDAGLPGTGLLIWRCNEHGDNMLAGRLADGNRLSNELSLEQADGRYDLEFGRNHGDADDLWLPGTSGFSSGSMPPAKWKDGSDADMTIDQLTAIENGCTFRCDTHMFSDPGDLIHRWSFNGSLEDSVGGLTATSSGTVRWNAEIPSNATQLRICGDGHNTAWVNLGTGIVPGEPGGSVTIEVWATPLMVQNWSRILDFGKDDENYLCMTWTSGTTPNSDRIEIKDDNVAIFDADDSLQPALGVPCHISLVITPADEGKATLSYAIRSTVTGKIIRSGTSTTTAAWDASIISTWPNCWLGRSRNASDLDACALYDEVRIWKTALTPAQLTWSARLGPDTLSSPEVPTAVTLTLTSTNGTVSVDRSAGMGSGTVTLSRTDDSVLVATPAGGYNFLRWTGDTGRIVSGGVDSPEITVATAKGDFALTAEYEANTPAVYAKLDGSQFQYLTANRKPAPEPDGGMNEGVTILFDSDAEYRQLKAMPSEVAKSAGVQLGGDVKLTDFYDWTEMEYSLGANLVDLNGKSLTTKFMNAATASAYSIPLVNSNFEADYVISGENIRTAPQGWDVGGGVRLLKNNLALEGDNAQNGSVWCVTDVGGYIQQQFKVEQAGELTVRYSNASAVGWSSYAIKIDGVDAKSETDIGRDYADRAFAAFVGSGTHTIQFTCTGGDTSVKGIEWDDIALNFTPKGGYTSSNNGIKNGSFEADDITSGYCIEMIPEGWNGGGEVMLLKNNRFLGRNNTENDSVWCVTSPNGYIEQTFRAAKAGNITVRYDNSSAVGQDPSWSSYAVKIDGVVVQSETNIHWQPSARSFTTEVTPGVHTIQFICTGSDSSVQGIEWDNISISGIAGVLEVQVPEGETVVNNDVAITGGGNLMVMKSGAGSFAANKSGQSYSGGNYVQEGSMTFAANTALGSSGEVQIDSGATVELGGKYDLNTFTFVLNGGTLQNTGGDVGDNYAQITSMRLTADSTFKPSNSYGLIGSNYGATTLDLGGHTLTVPIGGGKYFYLYNATVTAGTLDVTGGGWLVADKTAVNASAADLRANCALDVRVPFTVGGYEPVFASDSNAGDVPLTVTRSFKPHSSYYHGVELVNGDVIDLSACSGTLNTPGLFTRGANEIVFPVQEEYPSVDRTTLYVNLHGRSLGVSKILGWNAIPANVIFEATAETKADHYNFDVRADGIYVQISTVIIFR